MASPGLHKGLGGCVARQEGGDDGREKKLRHDDAVHLPKKPYMCYCKHTGRRGTHAHGHVAGSNRDAILKVLFQRSSGGVCCLFWADVVESVLCGRGRHCDVDHVNEIENKKTGTNKQKVFEMYFAANLTLLVDIRRSTAGSRADRSGSAPLA